MDDGARFRAAESGPSAKDLNMRGSPRRGASSACSSCRERSRWRRVYFSSCSSSTPISISDERARMEPRSDAAGRGDSRARAAARPTRPIAGKGTVSFPEMRRGGVGLCVATQIARYVRRTTVVRLALAGAGVGADAGAARLVSGDGGARRARADRRRGGARRALRAGQDGRGRPSADRLRPEPGGGRLDRHARSTSSAPTRRACAPSGRRTTGPASTPRAPTPPAVWGRTAASCCARWSGSA